MFSFMTLCAGGRPPLGQYLLFVAALLCLVGEWGLRRSRGLA